MSDLSRRDVAYLFFKRKNQVLAAFAASVLLATVGSYLTPRAYRATATVYMVRNLPPIAATGPTSLNAMLDRREVLNSEADLITSRAVAERVATELGLLTEGEDRARPAPSILVSAIRAVPAAIRWTMLRAGLVDPPASRRDGVVTGLLQGVSATPAVNSNFITITFQAEDPAFAAAAVNAFTTVYLEQRLTLLKRPGLETFYDGQIARARATVDMLDREIVVIKDQTGVVSADEQLKLSLEEQSGINTAIREVQSSTEELQGRIESLQRQLQGQPDSVVSSRVLQRNPNLAALEQRRLDLEAERAAELNRFAPDSPPIEEFDRRIARVKEAMDKEPATVVSSESMGVNAVRSSLQTDLFRAQSDHSAAVVRERELLARRDAVNQRVRQLDADTATLRRLSEASANALRVYDTYVRQKEEARMATATDPGVTNVQVVSPGTVPGRPVYPRMLQISIGAVLGLILGIGYVVVAEIFGQTLDRREDVERELGLPVLASIPYVAAARHRLGIS